jgi:exopolyphosphatase/guanosine-5'-triphosphate,3'-diphosphate pyrophosphatase
VNLETAASFQFPKAPKKTVEGRIGVVDIGSNTVRLVVYDVPQRLPFPMFNEKVNCRLASGLQETGRLNPVGVKNTLKALGRFVKLSDAMGVERLELLATAAVRDASDGSLFVDRIEDAFGIPVKVLSGLEESQLAALGVLNGMPLADGLLGDLGGGSLDLVALNEGSFGKHATMPLGHLRLSEAAGYNLEKAQDIIDKYFAGLPLLADLEGRTLYAVGGSWRKIAKIVMEYTHYPLGVVDSYTLNQKTALTYARRVAGMSRRRKTVERLGGSRADTLPFSALVLGRLLEIGRPKQVVFSGFGMREGQMIRCLPPALRHQDPLIMGCITMAERTARFSIGGEELVAWMAPLFDQETPEAFRLRLAACILSDIGWSQHPDYRAEHVFNLILRLPFAGLTHRDRAFLALTLFVRHGGDLKNRAVESIRKLLNQADLKRVRMIGLALRLAHTVSGSAPGMVRQTELKKGKEKLALKVPKKNGLFLGAAVERRLKRLGRVLGLKGTVS